LIPVALLDVDQHETGQDEETQSPSGVFVTIPLRSIDAVTAHVAFIEEAQAKVTAEMESMILTGLHTLVGCHTCHLLIIYHGCITIHLFRFMRATIDESYSLQNQSLLASSLQTAHNLRVLPELVQGLVTGLCDTTEEQIRDTFDLNKISKDALVKGKHSFCQLNR
jgi:conserved oligomeric Golgi complex subunit 5